MTDSDEKDAEQRYRAPEEAYAVRLVRIVDGKLRNYEAFWVDSVGLLVRRALLVSRDGDEEYGMLDVLSEDGSIIDEVPLSHRSFQYVKRMLRCRVEPEEVWTPKVSRDDR